jgi:hypothetical protein
LRSYPDRLDFVIHRWLAILPIFGEDLRQGVTETGEVPINLDDHAIVPGLAFCDNRPEYFLVADPPYLAAKGYAQVRAHYAANDVAWDQRRPIAMWRVGTSGHPTDRSIGWRTLPRIRLCEIGREHPDIIDAGITGIAQMPNAYAAKEVRNSGLMAGFVPVNDFNKFRYQIAIDGNSNS